MGEQMVRMKSEVFGRPSVMNYHVKSVEKKNYERRGFEISEVSCDFTKVSSNVFYYIVTFWLAYHNFCTRWVPEIFMGAHKT
jgi:hypothetical protein